MRVNSTLTQSLFKKNQIIIVMTIKINNILFHLDLRSLLDPLIIGLNLPLSESNIKSKKYIWISLISLVSIIIVRADLIITFNNYFDILILSFAFTYLTYLNYIILNNLSHGFVLLANFKSYFSNSTIIAYLFKIILVNTFLFYIMYSTYEHLPIFYLLKNTQILLISILAWLIFCYNYNKLVLEHWSKQTFYNLNKYLSINLLLINIGQIFISLLIINLLTPVITYIYSLTLNINLLNINDEDLNNNY
jgi:hypothetical protein